MPTVSVVFGHTVGQSFVVQVVEPPLDYSIVLQILGSTVREYAPTSLLVAVAGGQVSQPIEFHVDGHLVLTSETDSDGAMEPTSIPIPDIKVAGSSVMTAGEHTLTCTQGATSGTATFTLDYGPAPAPQAIGPDAPPADIPAATLPSGHRRWILQDLQPGGLGSWVMPMNPKTWDGPPFERELSVRTTTAADDFGGQYHIYESASMPVDRTFEGYCPSEEMRLQLEAYGDLNRRFYLIDHQGRAWLVTFTVTEMVPRLVEYFNGEEILDGHDYKVIATIYSRDVVKV